MIFATAISRQDPLLDSFYSSTLLQDSAQRFYNAANKLDGFLRTSYVAVTSFVEDIRPAFQAAAVALRAMMDKISIKGKEGQALFDKPGMFYESAHGERVARNKIRRKERRSAFLRGHAPAY